MRCQDSDEAKRSSLQLQAHVALSFRELHPGGVTEVPLKRSSRTPSVAEELSTSDREAGSRHSFEARAALDPLAPQSRGELAADPTA